MVNRRGSRSSSSYTHETCRFTITVQPAWTPQPTPPVQPTQPTWTPPPKPVQEQPTPAWTPPTPTSPSTTSWTPPQPTPGLRHNPWTPPPTPVQTPPTCLDSTNTHSSNDRTADGSTPSRQPSWQSSVQSVQEQPTPSIPPSYPSLLQPTPPAPPNISIGAGQQTPPPPNWANTPVNNPFNNNQQVPQGQQNYHGNDSGGIDKFLIGAGLGVLLFLLIGGIAWTLLSGDKQDDTIQVEQIAPEPSDDVEDVEPSNEDVEELEEIEEVEEAPPPPPKRKVQKKKKRGSTKKKPPKKTTPPKETIPKQSLFDAPTTVGLGEFSVTIRFNKPATLKCGDGQSKDFVNQTKMTFTTPTACRINTEDGEQGALSASKSGTIRCSLSGTRIRCK